jgi:hypothetical protein
MQWQKEPGGPPILPLDNTIKATPFAVSRTSIACINRGNTISKYEKI